MNDINEALKKLTHDAILQKIDSIAITYHTTDGKVHSYSFVDANKSIYELIGMIDELRVTAYLHFDTNNDTE